MSALDEDGKLRLQEGVVEEGAPGHGRREEELDLGFRQPEGRPASAEEPDEEP